MTSDTTDSISVGISQLSSFRKRGGQPPKRHASPPANPKPEGVDWTAEQPEPAAAAPQAPAAPAAVATPPVPAPAPPPARQKLDVNDPAARIVEPTVLSLPASLADRFHRARKEGATTTNTSIVLDALRQHVHELPALVLGRRPAPKADDLFPWRDPAPAVADKRAMVHIRPTRGELAVMQRLIAQVDAVINQQRPGEDSTNRSEMIAAALDAYLPAARKGK
jgi:metal-responsive CopG/Arc/MetJ family transcriptional regulator